MKPKNPKDVNRLKQEIREALLEKLGLDYNMDSTPQAIENVITFFYVKSYFIGDSFMISVMENVSLPSFLETFFKIDDEF